MGKVKKHLKKVITISDLPRWRLFLALIGSSWISIMFLIMRIGYTTSSTYSFMVWNLFLAWLPLFFVILLRRINRKKAFNKSLFAILAFLWILFFPNALYIITDLFHLKFRVGAPLWFDLIMLVSFSWNGLILGFYSLFLMQIIVGRKFGNVAGWIFAVFVLVVSSFGIYIGRYQRWNSWDVFINPIILLQDICYRLLSPFEYPALFGMTILFSLFFVVGYYMFFAISNLSNDSAFNTEEDSNR